MIIQSTNINSYDRAVPKAPAPDYRKPEFSSAAQMLYNLGSFLGSLFTPAPTAAGHKPCLSPDKNTGLSYIFFPFAKDALCLSSSC